MKEIIMNNRFFLIVLIITALSSSSFAISLFGLGPRAGLSKSGDSDAKFMIGASARLKLGGFGVEGAIDYRSDKYLDDQLTVKQWPVSASVLLYPLPFVYGLAGAGWYNSTWKYDLPNMPGLEDKTEQQMGYHIGAGVELPIIKPTIAADIRYVFLDYDLSDLPAGTDVEANYYTITVSLFWGF
jgi:hypothetical protein